MELLEQREVDPEPLVAVVLGRVDFGPERGLVFVGAAVLELAWPENSRE